MYNIKKFFFQLFILICVGAVVACTDSSKSVSSKNVSSKKVSAAIELVPIPGKNFSMARYEVTQKQFRKIMKVNPSPKQGDSLPVGNVSWNDAVYFCNLLSLKERLEPVYSIDGEVDPKKWGYTPCKDERLPDSLKIDHEKNGYRLPTLYEWSDAAYGGEDCIFAGGNVVDEVAWMSLNSDGEAHQVGLKNPNGYGLYDMSGNIWEWTDSIPWRHQRSFMGGSWRFMEMYERINSNTISTHPNCRDVDMGFRVCRTVAQ